MRAAGRLSNAHRRPYRCKRRAVGMPSAPRSTCRIADRTGYPDSTMTCRSSLPVEGLEQTGCSRSSLAAQRPLSARPVVHRFPGRMSAVHPNRPFNGSARKTTMFRRDMGSANGCSRRLRTGTHDPKEPAAVFQVNDRSTLELDLRRSSRANQSWRLQSFAPADRRPATNSGRTAAPGNCELAHPTLLRHSQVRIACLSAAACSMRLANGHGGDARLRHPRRRRVARAET